MAALALGAASVTIRGEEMGTFVRLDTLDDDGTAPVSRTGREWDRGIVLSLASSQCSHCGGLGHLPKHKGFPGRGRKVCKCAYRGVFRQCYRRYQECSLFQDNLCAASGLQRDGFNVFGHKMVEFMADFESVCRRALSSVREDNGSTDIPRYTRHFESNISEQARLIIFRYGLLERVDYRQVCRLLKIEETRSYFHEVYRMQAHLGLVLHELKPYALHPLSEYFHRELRTTAQSAASKGDRCKLSPPVQMRKQEPEAPLPNPQPIEPADLDLAA